MQDIKEPRQTEEALNESRRYLKALFDNSLDAILVNNDEGRYIDANPAACAQFGYTHDEFVQLSVLDLTAEVFREEGWAMWEQFLARGSSSGEYSALRKDGTVIQLEFRAVANILPGVHVACSRDITERKRAEEAQREAEQKYRDIFENAPEGIFQTLPDGRFVVANPALARMFGFDSPDELIRERADISNQHYVAPQRREQLKRSLRESGLVLDFEMEAYRKDRSRIWISENIRAVRDDHGSVLYYEGTSVDITDRKRAETRSAGFANLAHRLSGARTPLAAGRIIAETADKLFGWDSCSLNLYDAENDVVRSMLSVDTIAGERVSATLVSDRKPTPRSKRVIAHGPELTLRVEPIEFDEDAVPIGDTSRPSAALMTAPIRHASRVIGILSFQSYSPRAYDQVAFKDLQALSDHCGEALNRLQAENQLQESEERYRDLVENSHDLICTHDLDGLILSANRAAMETIGYGSEGYPVGANLRDMLPPEERDKFDDYLKRILADGVASGVMLVQTRTGEKRIWEYRNTLRTRGVSAPIVRGMARDVTEQTRVEEALRESESFRRMIIESEPECVKLVAPDYTLLDMNPAGLKMCEATSREQVIGQSVLNLIAPECRDIFMAMHQRVCQGESLVSEFEFIGLKGSRRWMESHAAPLLDKSSNVIAQLAITRDVTERKRTEDALREAERKYREIFENAGEGIFQSTPEGKFIAANPALARMHGFASPKELMDSRQDIASQIYVDPARREDFKRQLEEQGAIRGFEHRVFRKDGSKIWTSGNARAVRDEKGRILYYEGTTQDITERKQAQDDLTKQKEILEKIVDHIPLMINFTDSDGRIKLVNREWQRTLGWSSEEALSEDIDVFSKCYPDPEYRRDVIKFIAESNGNWVDFKTRVKGGTVIDTSWVRVKLSDGTSIGIGANITERKSAEEALKLFRNLIDQSSDAIEVLDAHTMRFLDCNATAHQTLGYTREEFLSLSAFDIDPTINESMLTSLTGEIDKPGFMIFESVHLRKDGSTFPVEINVKVIRLERDYRLAVVRDITERKRAEAALRESEERYRELFENAKDATYVHDLKGRYLSVNRAAEKLAGRSREEIVGRKFTDFVPLDQIEVISEHLCRKLVDEGETAYETEVIARDGRHVPVEVSSHLIYHNGVSVGVQGTARDITERKRAEELLRAKEQRFRSLIENSSDAIALLTEDGRIIYASPSTPTVIGFSPEELLRLTAFDLLDPEDHEGFSERLATLLANPRTRMNLQIRVRHKDGSWRWIEGTLTNLLDESGIGAIVNNYRDITDRKLAEEALRQSEERFSRAFHSSPAALSITVLDDGRLLEVNAAFLRMTGFSRSEVIGSTTVKLGLWTSLDRLAMEEALRERGAVENLEIQFRKKSGEMRDALLSAELIRLGARPSVLGIAQDVTERKRAEKALRSYSRQLIEAQEAERKHIARELHDQIGQVLTAVRINLQTIAHSSVSSESAFLIDQGMVIIDEALEKVRDLSFELRPSLLDNLGLVAALRWYADQYMQRTGIKTKSVTNLPEGQTRLRQELETACFRIVQEALTNVVRHANAKNVSIDLGKLDHKIVLSIKDDGIGFDEFSQNGGTFAIRLGLTGMKERALALGGTLEIESVPAQGTEIRAYFPTDSKED